MDVREKLVELVRNAHKKCKAKKTCHECEQYGNGSDCVYLFMADELIAHGVTVQEWISVKDRLPTSENALPDGSVYAYTKAKKVLVLHYQYVCRRSDYILCWMSIAMPQPPNEVEQ